MLLGTETRWPSGLTEQYDPESIDRSWAHARVPKSDFLRQILARESIPHNRRDFDPELDEIILDMLLRWKVSTD
jgi:hypothetical protein